MCGISCTLQRKNHTFVEKPDCLKKLLQNRGPDGYSEVEIDSLSHWKASFTGCTLWTQGPSITKQPLKAPNGSLFLWNGDRYTDLSTVGDENALYENDSQEVFSKVLLNGISYLTELCGPYAFIYFDSDKQELWFGRDVLGRHSLLWTITENEVTLLSTGVSWGPNIELSEVPSYGLFKIEFSAPDLVLNMYPWCHVLVPSEINVGIAFVKREKIQHKVLTSQFGTPWLEDEPKVPAIIENFGNVREKETTSIFQEASVHSLFAKIISDLKDILFRSVRKRIKLKPMFCRNCLLSKEHCTHCKLGILFSGGLDSAILAFISNSFVDDDEPIDLYNVAFKRSPEHNFNSAPDRVTGRKTLEELKYLCPKRTWNFIEINVSPEELNELRHKHISKLINPLTSVLDDSLGCALWFAARGEGLLDGKSYSSPARVVLLGMGADELFGGYSKHRKVFLREGWKGLGRELCASISNIGERNLGRDNRVVADHGRQPRTPYLDEDLVAYVNLLPPWQRCFLYPNIPAGIGDKFILRLLAWKLGLKKTSTLPKKALQFGSRIANPKEKGHMTCERL